MLTLSKTSELATSKKKKFLYYDFHRPVAARLILFVVYLANAALKAQLVILING